MQARLPQVSKSIRHAHNRTCRVRLTLKLALCSACTESHMSSKTECKSRTLFGMHRNAYASKIASNLALYSSRIALVFYSASTKRICQVRLTTSLVPYSARVQNAHVKEGWLQVSYSIRSRKETCMPSEFDYNTRTPFGTHKTHISSENDHSTRNLFGMHMSKKIASSLQLYSTRTETHMSSKIASSPYSIWHAHKTHM